MPGWLRYGVPVSTAAIGVTGLRVDIEIGEAGRGDHRVGHVDAEAVHASVEPEPEDGVELIGDRRVVPVPVGLFGGEQVQVPLARPAVGIGGPLPGPPTEHRGPVVRRDVPVLTETVTEDVDLALR